MNHLAIALLCGLAMLSLSMAMDKYHADWWGRELPVRSQRVLRCLGWLALALSLGPVYTAPAPSLALVAWFGYLSAAAACVEFCLITLSRWRLRRKPMTRSKAPYSTR